MNELIIATIIGWAITKVLDKKAAQAPEPSGQLAPGYSQKLGKVIGKWPSVVPDTAGGLNKLFSADENFIGPGALCQWPQKFQVRNVILQSFVYENQLVAQYRSYLLQIGKVGLVIRSWTISRHKSSCEKIYTIIW
jgi:hypothetical protein